MPIGRLPIRRSGFFQARESVTSLSIGLLIQHGGRILLLQIKLYTLTERIHRRPGRVIWKRNIFVRCLILFLFHWLNRPFPYQGRASHDLTVGAGSAQGCITRSVTMDGSCETFSGERLQIDWCSKAETESVRVSSLELDIPKI